MQRFFRSGFSHAFILILIAIVLAFLASPLKKYIYSTYQNVGLKMGINLNNIASEDYEKWVKEQTQELDSGNTAIFLNKRVPFFDTVASLRSDILGEQTNEGERWIEIDLSDQRLYLKEGNNTAGNFLISSGKWAPTPTGEWRIWTKLRYTRMTGGSKALGTYYNLPNVPYTMYYYRGYGIHGAYWHNNFGHPMSHGCINMKPEEAGIAFNWASVGTRVVVHQ
ncbi:hypothetical protein A2693_03725 [Candidatus Curtissbacteria bacterium RIFCSPHIGHO2_01_FULL_40_12]|uniref:L,D-TPase catalytic domain-containing protein n=1 Tax=Candidatus Curtissbacteria bacterium RIFCSPHIGHO2_01_FULL_40_12 TaxID=1797710 RepID=A0A1F5G9L0_9BACT|nr:MAG: hypothetical protein A2693_03725 [Candidatus Curtissbacteria bacterium RIFCSPHIGHO2_01_FULL_40_12]